MKEIIVLFKTHLDVGFTDFSQVVLDNYIHSFIPKAIEVARGMHDRDERFIWTTGSWLIEQFLRHSHQKEMMIEAIKNGDVRWHGLPFTTHTELMDEDLFKYGLSLSSHLDQQFHKKTIAAKMTDVPGHTKAIIPYMAQAGIKFLHLGVNPASTVPEVPTLFKWKAETGEELVVMYHNNYGEFTEIPGTGVGVYFAHTGDNQGPQSVEVIENIYNELRKKYPNVHLRAGTLEDVAEIAIQVEDLPVITSEIGDTWIHGVGTDPKKISQYRALLRLKDEVSPQEAQNICDHLLLVPEHTWGLNENTHLGSMETLLGEYRYFVRTEFEQARMTEKFQKMEKSWEEQRSYITTTLESLEDVAKEKAMTAVESFRRETMDLTAYVPLQTMRNIKVDDYIVSFNENGAICKLIHKDKMLADQDHLWGSILYEAFSINEYDRFQSQYLTNRYQWALEDFGKIGMDQAIQNYQQTSPQLEGLYQKENEIVAMLTMSGEAVELYGAPKKLVLNISFLPNEVKLDLAWWEKEASRVAEAIWCGIHPLGEVKSVSKLGQLINPVDIVHNGNRKLHATDKGVTFDTCRIECIDSALVHIGKPSLLNFNNEIAKVDEGVYFNLFNNIWGTNFVMWYDDDARFRFNVKI